MRGEDGGDLLGGLDIRVAQAQLEPQAQTLRQIQESGNQELQRILLPAARPIQHGGN